MRPREHERCGREARRHSVVGVEEGVGLQTQTDSRTGKTLAISYLRVSGDADITTHDSPYMFTGHTGRRGDTGATV